MNALRTVERELRVLGYKPETVIRDYDFVDVLSGRDEPRRVDLAVFTHMPESYGIAAFGVISGTSRQRAIAERRALGAPIVVSINDNEVGIWQVWAHSDPTLLERAGLEALPELFERNQAQWRLQAVHGAKSLCRSQPENQRDFVDLGLVPAIEREAEEKLDRLLGQVLRELPGGLEDECEELAFRKTFRLLAAKILLDRERPEALKWSAASADSVLEGIEDYYGLGGLSRSSVQELPQEAVATAWDMLREAISFRNVSSDSLAFVYENTLVTTGTRKRFGTHSTPRQVAEYVLGRLDLPRLDLGELKVFKPFSGAGTFLVAALRPVRDLLPEGLNAEQRHALPVSHCTFTITTR